MAVCLEHSATVLCVCHGKSPKARLAPPKLPEWSYLVACGQLFAGQEKLVLARQGDITVTTFLQGYALWVLKDEGILRNNGHSILKYRDKYSINMGYPMCCS